VHTRGAIDAMALYAGQSVGAVRRIEPAAPSSAARRVPNACSARDRRLLAGARGRERRHQSTKVEHDVRPWSNTAAVAASRSTAG
jgi:hypothetical protein